MSPAIQSGGNIAAYAHSNFLGYFKGEAGRKAFEQFDALMEQRGFAKLEYNSVLHRDNEVIYNRGLKGGKSNYFVFVRAESDGMRVLCTNPDYSDSAALLPPEQINIVQKVGYGSETAAVGTALHVIGNAAAKKPEYSYFAVLHGHWGSFNGKSTAKLHLDDGRSPDRAVMRQMMFYNADFDATGCHNHLPLGEMGRISAIEESAGIVKVPSCELTMPYTFGKPNGPHHNIWLGSMEAAEEYNENVLANRQWIFPPYAPYKDPGKIVKKHDGMREKGQLAVGIAHPACDLALPAVGILNRVGTGDYKLEDVFTYIKKHVDMVAVFNPTIPAGQEIKFTNPKDGEYFRELLKSQGMGGKLFLNAVNIAFGRLMAEACRKPGYADHDTHRYWGIGDGSQVHALGMMANVFDMGPRDGRKPTAGEFVRFMLAPDALEKIHAFVPYELTGDKIAIVKARNGPTLGQKAVEIFDMLVLMRYKGANLLHDSYTELSNIWK